MGVSFYVGSSANPAGVVLVFCNGAETSRERAEKSAVLISQKYGDQFVNCFYNPSRFQRQDEHSSPTVEKLGTLFYQFITKILREQKQAACEKGAIRIVLFLHSQSTVLAMHAINNLDRQDRNFLEIYTFGAALIIPNSYGRIVNNFVHENDSICEGSNNAQGEFALADIKKLRNQEKLGTPLFLAIFKTAQDDLLNHLSPKREGYEYEPKDIREKKNERFKRIFVNPSPTGQDLIEDSFFQRRCQYYHSLLENYTITQLPGIPLKNMEAESFEQFCTTCLKYVVINSLKNHHFDSYQDAFGQIDFNHKFTCRL